jgi:anhydro-N-acetylmuramic acid kinase
MTSAITFPAWVIGLMSGTSGDGVDAALLYTDGKTITQSGASVFVPYDHQLRVDLLNVMYGVGDEHAVAQSITEIHRQAVEALIGQGNVPRDEIKLIGFHGQTIRHAPKEGITVQIGDAAQVAARVGIPVVFDFRIADVKAGGQGAPLVPLYHAALAEKLEKPLLVVNIGGVANVTYIDADTILAFDCGPGNALIDDWVFKHTKERCDEGGQLATKGTVDRVALERFLADPFFQQPAPKSLDRNHFLTFANGDWSLEDGTATLTAMTAAAIAEAVRAVPQIPKQLLICGGGRHNPTLMGMLKQYQLPVHPVEEVGWNGDMLEAEAFAYLAARSVQGLPLSLPTTTGVQQPQTGGVLYLSAPVEHSHHHHHDDEDDDCTSPRPCCH